MVMKEEAKQIQETNFLCASDKERLESSQSLKWHLCVCCEPQQTGKTKAEVMDSTFKKQTEHKLNRVRRYQEFLLRREKRKLVLSNLEAKGKAPAVVAKDVKAHNDLVPKLKESSVKDDKVTKASTPEVHSFTDEDDWEELRRTLPDPEDPLVEMDINKVLFEAKAQDSYIPASSYQVEWASSKDRTCSCSGSLQVLADCYTFFMVRV